MPEPHPWNVTPLVPPLPEGALYRLMMVKAAPKDHGERVIATAERQAPLVELQHQLEGLGFDLQRLERLEVLQRQRTMG